MNKADLAKNIKDWWNGDSGIQSGQPAVLFERSSSTQLPTIYLFANFGATRGSEIGQKSQITTHYTEQNNHVNDHWAISPLTYTLTGLIGELTYTAPTSWANASPFSTPSIYSLQGMIAPSMDSATRSAYNIYQRTQAVAERYRQTIRSALSNIGVIKAQPQQTNQEYVFRQLMSLEINRQLVSIYTPYGGYEDMAIINVRMNNNDLRYISELTVDMQQWRNVGELAQRAATKQEKEEMARLQQAIEQNNGQASTTQVSRRETDAFVLAGRPQRIRPYQNN